MRRRDLFPELRGGLHDLAVVMAGRAIDRRDRRHRSRPLMLGVTGGTGAVLDHIRFVKIVLLVALQAGLIDPRERGRAVTKAILQDLDKAHLA